MSASNELKKKTLWPRAGNQVVNSICWPDSSISKRHAKYYRCYYFNRELGHTNKLGSNGIGIDLQSAVTTHLVTWSKVVQIVQFEANRSITSIGDQFQVQILPFNLFVFVLGSPQVRF